MSLEKSKEIVAKYPKVLFDPRNHLSSQWEGQGPLNNSYLSDLEGSTYLPLNLWFFPVWICEQNFVAQHLREISIARSTNVSCLLFVAAKSTVLDITMPLYLTITILSPCVLSTCDFFRLLIVQSSFWWKDHEHFQAVYNEDVIAFHSVNKITIMCSWILKHIQ